MSKWKGMRRGVLCWFTGSLLNCLFVFRETFCLTSSTWPILGILKLLLWIQLNEQNNNNNNIEGYVGCDPWPLRPLGLGVYPYVLEFWFTLSTFPRHSTSGVYRRRHRGRFEGPESTGQGVGYEWPVYVGKKHHGLLDLRGRGGRLPSPIESGPQGLRRWVVFFHLVRNSEVGVEYRQWMTLESCRQRDGSSFSSGPSSKEGDTVVVSISLFG